MLWVLPHGLFLVCVHQDLEARVKALEEGATFAATQTAIRTREEEFLATLQEIKDTMVQEAASGDSGAASSAEVNALKKENETPIQYRT